MKKLRTKLFTIAICLGILAVVGSACKKTKPSPIKTDPPTVTDVDGNVYTTIRIGSQLWTVENLKTSRYNDGTLIGTSWAIASSGACGTYDDNVANGDIYGKFYNWGAVNTGKLAPKGWHVPSRAEWEALVSASGGSSAAGGNIKSLSTLWAAPNLGATNSSKFSALPSGYRTHSGLYALLGEAAYWWASSERNATQGDYIRVTSSLAGTATNGADKSFGYAVRCVKD